MKKTLALLTSLLVFAGAKAQSNPAVKKETVKPVVTRPKTDSMAPVQKNGTIKQAGSSIKQTATDTHIKNTMKEGKITKITPVKDMKEIKVTSTPAVKYTPNSNKAILKK